MRVIKFKETIRIQRAGQPEIVFNEHKQYLLYDRLAKAVLMSVQNSDKNATAVLEFNKPLQPDFLRNIDCVNSKDFLLSANGTLTDVCVASYIASELYNTFKVKSMLVKVQAEFKPLVKWFAAPVLTQDYFTDVTNDFILDSYFINLEDLTVNDDNIYQAAFNSLNANAPIIPMRPQLRRERVSNSKSRIKNGEVSVLLVPRGDNYAKSTGATEMYTALMQVAKFTKIHVYAHMNKLTETDEIFLSQQKNVTILDDFGIDQYLLDLYDCTQVICVDNEALHFREGVAKSCIALFGSTSAASRCNGFAYTKGYDIRGGCNLQPCNHYDKQREDVCEVAMDIIEAQKDFIHERFMAQAPCLSTHYNKTLNEQLVTIFKNHFV